MLNLWSYCAFVHNEAERRKFCVRFNTLALFAKAREHADVTAQIIRGVICGPTEDVFTRKHSLKIWTNIAGWLELAKGTLCVVIHSRVLPQIWFNYHCSCSQCNQNILCAHLVTLDSLQWWMGVLCSAHDFKPSLVQNYHCLWKLWWYFLFSLGSLDIEDLFNI